MKLSFTTPCRLLPAHLNFEPAQGFDRRAAFENKSAHGEPVEPLERDSFLVSEAIERLERLELAAF
jgi:hypothetical protein